MQNIKPKQIRIPQFIKFMKEDSDLCSLDKRNSLSHRKAISTLTDQNFFITNEHINHEMRVRKKFESYEKVQENMFNTFYRHFPYEPEIYNEMQFIYLNGNSRLIPRKFNEVIKDCNEIEKYNKYMKRKNKLSDRKENQNFEKIICKNKNEAMSRNYNNKIYWNTHNLTEVRTTFSINDKGESIKNKGNDEKSIKIMKNHKKAVRNNELKKLSTVKRVVMPNFNTNSNFITTNNLSNFENEDIIRIQSNKRKKVDLPKINNKNVNI